VPEKKDRKADQNLKTNLFFVAVITKQTKKEKKAETVFTAQLENSLSLLLPMLTYQISIFNTFSTQYHYIKNLIS